MKHLKMTQLISKLRISFLVTLLLGLLLVPAVSVLAEDGNSSSGSSNLTEAQKQELEAKKKAAEELREQAKQSRESRKKALEEAKSAREDKKLEKSQELAKHLTEERLELLKKLQSGEYTKKCRATAKTEAEAAIAAVVARLEQDQTSVDSLTTVEDVRTLIKSGIVGKNHVYVGLLPAVRGMCVSDRIIGLVDGKLTTIANQLKAAGLDTTNLESLLADTKTKAQAAYTAYKKIADNPGSSTYQADLATAKTALKTAKTALSAVREEIDVLKQAVDDDSAESSTP